MISRVTIGCLDTLGTSFFYISFFLFAMTSTPIPDLNQDPSVPTPTASPLIQNILSTKLDPNGAATVLVVMLFKKNEEDKEKVVMALTRGILLLSKCEKSAFTNPRKNVFHLFVTTKYRFEEMRDHLNHTTIDMWSVLSMLGYLETHPRNLMCSIMRVLRNGDESLAKECVSFLSDWVMILDTFQYVRNIKGVQSIMKIYKQDLQSIFDDLTYPHRIKK